MAGKGRDQGGMSGGARVGTGPKKRPGAPPTRKEKRAARKAAKAATAREATKAAQAQPVPVVLCACRAFGAVRCVLHDDEVTNPFIEPQERQSERAAAAAEAKEEEAASAKEAKKKGLGTLHAFFPKTQVQQSMCVDTAFACVLTCHALAHALPQGV